MQPCAGGGTRGRGNHNLPGLRTRCEIRDGIAVGNAARAVRGQAGTARQCHRIRKASRWAHGRRVSCRNTCQNSVTRRTRADRKIRYRNARTCGRCEIAPWH